MPDYDYECKCGNVEEREFSMDNVKAKVKCSKCGKMAVRMFSKPNKRVCYRGPDAMANITGFNARRNRGRGW